MNSTAQRGNDPDRWSRLILYLDERLQLGLLDRLRRVASYHFEGELLTIEAANRGDEEYLSKAAVLQQLKLLADDAVGVTSVKVIRSE